MTSATCSIRARRTLARAIGGLVIAGAVSACGSPTPVATSSAGVITGPPTTSVTATPTPTATPEPVVGAAPGVTVPTTVRRSVPQPLAAAPKPGAPKTTAPKPAAPQPAAPKPAAPQPAAPKPAAPQPAAPRPAAPQPAAPKPAPKPAVSYANCTAVKAAGAAPIHAGEPGYSRTLDRDGDGVACET